MAVSTTEAEYIAAAQAVKEALYLRSLLSDLGIVNDTFQIRADNQSALKLLKNPEFSYISTHEMMADIFTKPVPGNKLQICCEGIGVE